MVSTCDERTERITRITTAFRLLIWINMRRLWRLLQGFGLTHPQFITLLALSRHPLPCPMNGLTAALMHDPPTMTGIVDRLVKMGLVERTRSETDRRLVLVQVTPAGVDLVRQIDQKFTEDDFFGYATLNDEELGHLEKLLNHVLRMHVRRYAAAETIDTSTDLDETEMEALLRDPIAYVKQDDKRWIERIGWKTSETLDNESTRTKKGDR